MYLWLPAENNVHLFNTAIDGLMLLQVLQEWPLQQIKQWEGAEDKFKFVSIYMLKTVLNRAHPFCNGG